MLTGRPHRAFLPSFFRLVVSVITTLVSGVKFRQTAGTPTVPEGQLAPSCDIGTHLSRLLGYFRSTGRARHSQDSVVQAFTVLEDILPADQVNVTYPLNKAQSQDVLEYIQGVISVLFACTFLD